MTVTTIPGELVTTTTPEGTPVGSRTGKLVHLLWLSNGDDIWSLCDRKVRGKEVVVRDTDSEICTDCEDERDYREARAAKFEHDVHAHSSRQSSSNIAGSRGTYLCAEVFCRDCAPEGKTEVTLWSRNGTSAKETDAKVREHYLAMWRQHKAAERETARVAEYAARNRAVKIYRRNLRDAIEQLGDALTGLSAEDQANAIYDVLLADAPAPVDGEVK